MDAGGDFLVYWVAHIYVAAAITVFLMIVHQAVFDEESRSEVVAVASLTPFPPWVMLTLFLAIAAVMSVLWPGTVAGLALRRRGE